MSILLRLQPLITHVEHFDVIERIFHVGGHTFSIISSLMFVASHQ